ncbi:MAG TPA: hypothetical protein VF468_23070 [Actinomycetota bacterium]|nr:hypothetical protein [Actinomycetota bacterium]
MAQSATSPRRPGGELPGRGRVMTGVRLRPAAAADLAAIARARRFYARLGWRDLGPFTYQAQTATGTVAVPAHRYEREVGNR